jgi:acetyltransferase EpsM
MGTPTPLLVLGTSVFAREVADIASDCPELEVVGFVENQDPDRCLQRIDDLPVHWIEDVAALADSHRAICGLGTTRRHVFTEQAAERGLRFATVVHPAARVSTRTTLGEGSVVSAGAIIGSHTRIGRHVLVNRGALVGHHTEVGDHVSIQSGANVAGNCVVGPRVFVGMGAVVVDHVTVGELSVIGAGAVVTKDVPARMMVFGNPARVVQEDVEGR